MVFSSFSLDPFIIPMLKNVGFWGRSVTAKIGFSVDSDLHEKLLHRIKYMVLKPCGIESRQQKVRMYNTEELADDKKTSFRRSYF